MQDSEVALITLANFTTGGWRRNQELGIHVQDSALVKQIRADILSLFRVATELRADDGEPLSVVERVILGVRFGKRWRHMVRNAQQYSI